MKIWKFLRNVFLDYIKITKIVIFCSNQLYIIPLKFELEKCWLCVSNVFDFLFNRTQQLESIFYQKLRSKFKIKRMRRSANSPRVHISRMFNAAVSRFREHNILTCIICTGTIGTVIARHVHRNIILYTSYGWSTLMCISNAVCQYGEKTLKCGTVYTAQVIGWGVDGDVDEGGGNIPALPYIRISLAYVYMSSRSS